MIRSNATKSDVKNEPMNFLRNNTQGISTLMVFFALFTMGAYFIFAAVQGDYGHFKRVQVESEERLLKDKLATLQVEHARIANLTKRLSDDYLDLDLLDEQVRKRLGYARIDEVIIR